MDLKKIRDRCREDGDCWIWAQGVNGSNLPLMRKGSGRAVNARRLALFAVGKSPKKGERAHDTCGNLLCCNPDHLEFASYAKILSKTYRNGKRAGARRYLTRVDALMRFGKAKLNWEKAAEIRARPSERTAVLAAEYGVSESAIQNVRAGNSWRLNDVWQGLRK